MAVYGHADETHAPRSTHSRARAATSARATTPTRADADTANAKERAGHAAYTVTAANTEVDVDTRALTISRRRH